MVTNKIFSSSEDVQNIMQESFANTGLNSYGVTLRVMSVSKSKSVLKLTKASPTTEFLVDKSSILQVYVYEAAFERLPEESKHLLIEMMFSSVSYDLDKDKLVIDTNPLHQIFSMRRKYKDNFDDVLDKIELGDAIILEIEDELKAQKEAERELKSKK